jgi:hypothetical protein
MKKNLLVLGLVAFAVFGYFSQSQTYLEAGHGEIFLNANGHRETI